MNQTIIKTSPQNSKNQAFMTPLIILGHIFKYMFSGFKYVLYEGWIELFNTISYKADAAYRSVSMRDKQLEEGDLLYEKTRRKKKKEKVYTYSAKTLATCLLL